MHCIVLTRNFNPRPREEGDKACERNKDTESVISIHALVKRATGRSVNSTRRNGYFNPRPREEGDEKIEKLEKLIEISIHALVKRATSDASKMTDVQKISIHALVKRATLQRSEKT